MGKMEETKSGRSGQKQGSDTCGEAKEREVKGEQEMRKKGREREREGGKEKRRN